MLSLPIFPTAKIMLCRAINKDWKRKSSLWERIAEAEATISENLKLLEGKIPQQGLGKNQIIFEIAQSIRLNDKDLSSARIFRGG